MLWWSDKFGRGDGYKDDAKLARKAGLYVENMHTPVHEQNFLSLDSLDGESVYHTYLQCVEDCHDNEISTMVIHLPNDKYLLNNLGINRLENVVERAEKYNVNIAFENLGNLANLATVLMKFESTNVGYCYDSCHHVNYAPDVDLLDLYGSRLMALHLQDNGGTHNQHQLPFDGNIDWNNVMRKISETGYKGATTLEPMNWDYTSLYISEFLDLAYLRAKEIDSIRR